MKRRVLSILLTLCMVLMLCPVTAFADDYYTVTQNFEYGTLAFIPEAENPHTFTAPESEFFMLTKVENCAPYEFVGWKESVSGTVYEPWISLPAANLTFDAVYQVQGDLAITVDGFEVGKTPADCTCSFESTIPGVEFSADDIQLFGWAKHIFTEETSNLWDLVYETEAFEAGASYRILMDLDNKGLDMAPAVTVNGNTPKSCAIATRDGVPIQLQITCELGTPALTLTIDGPDVVCAQQDYEFTVTPPDGVTLEESFGYDAGMKGGSADLEIDEDGVGHGVVSVEWYDLQTNRFTLTARGTDDLYGDTVPGTKTVEVSPAHIYVDGVCGCGAVQQYTVEYIGSGDDPICVDFKTHGEDLTLRGETFTWDGYVQTGWVDKETGAIYDLGATYDEDRDATLYPYWEKLITVTAPFTTTVALGDAGEPGETTFMLGLIDGLGNELTFDDQYFFAEITTDGAGSYSGVMTITATEKWLYDMLYEGAFIWQYDGEEDGWTYDDTVWGVRLYMPEVAARSADEAAYKLLLYPACVADNGSFDLDLNAGPVDEMTFTNTYTAHVYELKHDATHHWDECACKDVQNKELHKYGGWKVTKEATQTAVGEKEHTCTICGYTEKAEIAKLPATDTTDTTKNNQNTGAATSPNTGDNSHMALWIALLFVSGAGVIGTTVYGKKKRVK